MNTSTAVTTKMNDAAFAAYCLNGCKGTESYDRLAALHRDLKEFRAKGIEQRQTRKGFVNLSLVGPLDRLHREISERLSRYHLRPAITYTAFGGECRGSVATIPTRENPVIVERGSRNRAGKLVQDFSIYESDVALALVRLYADGDIDKVRLCETCKSEWRVAAHRNYRFCSKQCREHFYKSQPDYHERKAKNQARHRKTLKEMRAKGIPC
jgi:hypothetical protein